MLHRLLFVFITCAALGAGLSAQGTIQGRVVNGAAPTTGLEATVVALVLPDDAHPFNEMCAGTWQEAMTALAEGREPTTPLGGLVTGVKPEQTLNATADANGQFRFDSLPNERRIALAARVDGLWWPAAREYWLSAEQPSATIEITCFRIDSNLLPSLNLHRGEANLTVRQDLKFAGIQIVETVRLENTDPTHAALVEIKVDVIMSPAIRASQLPALYGSELMFMQGTASVAANSVDLGSPLAAQSWRFGGGDTMHGMRPVYNRGPQNSADNWHRLNVEGLHMLGAGDTLYVDNGAPGGRSASIVFRRPVPPAIGGGPGTLVLRVSHRGGIPTEAPRTKIQITRSFPLELQRAEFAISDGLALQALIPEGHRRLYGPASGIEYASTAAPALHAGEPAEIILGLNDEAQAAVASMAEEPTSPAATPTEPPFKWNVLFQWLAGACGLGFVVALIASVRWTRERQLERLAALPGGRTEVLSSLANLEGEYKHGRVPPAAYLEQRQRLMNRLIEFDSREGEADEA